MREGLQQPHRGGTVKITWYWPDAALFGKMHDKGLCVAYSTNYAVIKHPLTGFNVCCLEDWGMHTQVEVAQLMSTLLEVAEQRFEELGEFYIEYALAIGALENAKEQVKRATAHWGEQIAKLK